MKFSRKTLILGLSFAILTSFSVNKFELVESKLDGKDTVCAFEKKENEFEKKVNKTSLESFLERNPNFESLEGGCDADGSRIVILVEKDKTAACEEEVKKDPAKSVYMQVVAHHFDNKTAILVCAPKALYFEQENDPPIIELGKNCKFDDLEGKIIRDSKYCL